jgi:2-dehydropantoate 2-reductase
MTHTPLRESIHILGAGAIGCLFASSLRSKFPDYPVALLLRKERQQQLRNKTMLEIHWRPHPSHDVLKNTKIEVPIEFIGDYERTDGAIPPLQNLVVTTKAYDALPAIQSVIPRMRMDFSAKITESFVKRAPRIILLCNGALAVKEDLQIYLMENHVCSASIIIPQIHLATTIHGAYREQTRHDACPPLSFVHAGYGQTFIEESASDLGILWNDAGLNCKITSNETMNALLWKKLAANCVINPLTTIYQCTNGELLLEPSFPELQHGILQEVAQVAAAARKTVQEEKSHDKYIDDNSNAFVPASPSLKEFREFVNQVIQETHTNRSSMLQDITYGRRTEIDHLNGYVVRKGIELKVECPINEDICQQIQELQQKSI